MQTNEDRTSAGEIIMNNEKYDFCVLCGVSANYEHVNQATGLCQGCTIETYGDNND